MCLGLTAFRPLCLISFICSTASPGRVPFLNVIVLCDTVKVCSTASVGRGKRTLDVRVRVFLSVVGEIGYLRTRRQHNRYELSFAGKSDAGGATNVDRSDLSHDCLGLTAIGRDAQALLLCPNPRNGHLRTELRTVLCRAGGLRGQAHNASPPPENMDLVIGQ